MSAVAQALRLYAQLPARVRFHTRVRACTCPFAAVLARTPAEGRLLEVGCGHGLFANAAALAHPALDVLGVDISGEKIGWARATVDGRPHIRFEEQPLSAVEGTFAAVAVLDVLYLVPRAEWPQFLAQCLARLQPGGRLLLKDVAPTPRWKFWRNVLQETLAVRVLGITVGGAFAFATRDEMRALLREAGFADVAVTEVHRGYSTPHVLYEAVRE